MIHIIKLEIKKNLGKWFVISLACYLLIAAALFLVGIAKYKLDLEQSRQFIDVQVKRVNGFINYEQYGAFGIDRLLIGSPLISLFYNSSTFKELKANAEITSRYNLYSIEMGRNLFERPTGGNLDFSWFFIVFFSAAVSAWGFFSLRNKDYILLIKSHTGGKTIFAGILLGRLFLVMAANILVIALAWLLFLLNGIALIGGEIAGLFHFFLGASLVSFVLMIVSAAWGAARNWKQGALAATICWILIVLVWPEILNAVFSGKAEINMKSLSEHHLQKNEKYLVFEKEALKNTGRYKSIPEREKYEKEQIEYYWNVVSKEIKALDLDMVERTETLARDFHLWSIFNPVTFYKSVNNETGSKGYNSYNRFFRDNLEIQRGFLRFVFNKRYYENYSKVKPYLPDDRLVEKAVPGLPAFYPAGLILNMVYILLALVFAYTRFKRYMFPKPEAANGYGVVAIEVQPGDITGVISDNRDLYRQAIAVFSGISHGPRGFNGEIRFGPRVLTGAAGTEKLKTAFVPNQDSMPGHLKIGVLLNTLAKLAKAEPEQVERCFRDHDDIREKRLSRLDAGQRACLWVDICGLSRPDVYILRDFKEGIRGKSLLAVINKLRGLKERGAAILALSEAFMRPDYTFNYTYNRKERRYEVLEDFEDTLFTSL